MQLRHKLFRNSAWTLAQLFVTTIAGLILPPILLRYLGLETYGIWALIILVNSYAALLDLGFGSSLIKYVAEADAIGDREQIAHLINGCLTVYVAIYIIGIALTLILGKPLMHALLGSSAQAGDYLIVFEIYAFVALTGLLTVPFSSLLKGMQRHDQSNMVEILAMLIGTGVTVGLITSGWRLESLVAGALAAVLWRLTSYIWLARATYSLFQFRWGGYQDFRRTIKRLARLSTADNSVRINNVVTQTVIRVSINSFAGVSYVGIYDLAKRVVSQISAVSTVVFVPLMPAVSSLAAQKKHESLNELLAKCYLYLSMIGLPLFYFMICFYDPVLTAWLRIENVGAISFAGRILLIAATVDILTGPATTSALGLGNPNLHLVKMIVTCVLSLLLVFLLGPKFGFTGVLIAEFCAVLGGAIVGLSLFQRWFDIPIFRIIFTALWRTTLVALPVWIVLGGAWVMSSHNALWQSLATWAMLLGSGGIMTVALYWVSGLLSSYELDIARNALLPSRAR